MVHLQVSPPQFLSIHSPLTRCSAANLPADCLNLGQGYMNFAPPKWITAAATEALSTVGANHYAHPKGRLRLRQAIKQFYGHQFNRDLDVESEIIVTSGANEGKRIFSTSGAIGH
jgi:kynurenine aminotransferase